MTHRIVASLLLASFLFALTACNSQPPPPKEVSVKERTPPPKKK